MDDPESDPGRLEKTLAQFELINRWLSGVRRILRQQIVAAMQTQPDRQYHLVDLGAGACETPAWLLNYTRRKGLKLQVTACDHDPRVVRFARNRYGSTPGLTILQRDISDLNDLGPIDFVFANHLLHHLPDNEITTLLRRLAQINPELAVLNDIRRHWRVYAGYRLLSSVWRSDSFARYDGLLSIRKGFRMKELKKLASEAGLVAERVRVKTVFPGHIVLTYPT